MQQSHPFFRSLILGRTSGRSFYSTSIHEKALSRELKQGLPFYQPVAVHETPSPPLRFELHLVHSCSSFMVYSKANRWPRTGQAANGGDTPKIPNTDYSGDPSGRKPPGRVPSKGQVTVTIYLSKPSMPQISLQTIEINGLLQNLAGVMQQVVTLNESNYRNIAVALQQVTSRLQESQLGPTEKATSNPRDRRSRVSPLELKVRQLYRSLSLNLRPPAARSSSALAFTTRKEG